MSRLSYTTNNITDDSISRTLRGYNGETIKISADSLDENGLKRKITQILLEDPDSEVKRMAEDYLIQCLYEATNDPENNPVLQRIFGKNKEEIDSLACEIYSIRNNISEIRSDLQELKTKLGIYSGYCSYSSEEGVAWNRDVQAKYEFLEGKLIKITEKLGKAGININYWEN